jgi:hypothetical protein
LAAAGRKGASDTAVDQKRLIKMGEGQMLEARKILLAAVTVSLAICAGMPAAQSRSCSFRSPGCAEWYIDSNANWHSIRSDWRGIQRHHAYRHQNAGY